MSSALIVGGGLAGLAAAGALAVRGVRVTLLESRPRLGGRASSFLDRAAGERIDNCQHVSMGCCTNFRHFCETAGMFDLFRRERTLYFIAPDGTINPLSASAWPAPLHLWPGLRGLSYLSREDKRSISQGLRALVRANAGNNGQTFDHWLATQAQPASAVRRFWEVVLVSALSESLDRIGVEPARKVFVEAFLAHRDGWEVQVPAVPLDVLYGERLSTWLAGQGVEIRLKTGAERVTLRDGRARGVVLRDGEHLSADHVILAVPQHRVLSLLPPDLAARAEFAVVAELESAPISSVHLW
ncbi:MAG: hydroxysqualene dehydroxylase, partial [Planctomycetaceae bacterium]